ALESATTPCPGLTLVSGPSFSPAANAPLAGVLKLTSDVDTRVSVSVDDGQAVWERDFYDYATTHTVPLFGFKPGRTNQITVTVHDRFRNALAAPQPLAFVTAPLPDSFPNLTVAQSDPTKMEPGYSLFMVDVVGAQFYAIIVDNSGQVVWYDSGLS